MTSARYTPSRPHQSRAVCPPLSPKTYYRRVIDGRNAELADSQISPERTRQKGASECTLECKTPETARSAGAHISHKDPLSWTDSEFNRPAPDSHDYTRLVWVRR